MRNDTAHIRHPSQHELMAHAESALDAKHCPTGMIADHVASCPICAAEVAAISASLQVIVTAPLLDPNLKAQSALMMRVRKERRKQGALRAGSRGVVRVTRGMAYAAAIVLVAAIAFGAALGNSPGTAKTTLGVNAPAPAFESARAQVQNSGASMEETFATVRSLSKAVQHPATAPLSPELREQHRTVDALGADLAAAQEALTRNPGCERASAVINASLERQAETLRDLYVHGTL